jgi:23S rRNA pseudouridine1911/1915/1917 synthase
LEKLDEINPEDLNLDIVFEDENIVIINKEAGVNTHPVP